MVLVLVAACLACVLSGSLSLDYTDSIGLFGLALLGLAWGLREGFVRGYSRAERWLLAIYALVPAAALASDEIARFTRLAFRFAGRDLRFLLAIPAYVAVRRLRLAPRMLGILLALGAILALIVGFAEVVSGQMPRAIGATGVAIVFGDLAVLSGIVAAAGLMLGRQRAPRAHVLLALGALGAGFGSAILSDSRGSWLGALVLVPLLGLAMGSRWSTLAGRRWLWTFGILLAAVLALGLVLGSRISPLRKLAHIASAVDRESTYLSFPRRTRERWGQQGCFSSRGGLDWLATAITIFPAKESHDGMLRIVDAPQPPVACRRATASALRFAVPYGYDVTTFLLPTSFLGSRRRAFALWVRGRLYVRTCWTCRSHFVQASSFRRIVVHGRSVGWAVDLFFTLRPGWKAWVLPIQGRPSEYSAAPLRNSIDERFEMWRAALLIAQHHPLWGVGFGGYERAAQRLFQEGRAPSFVAVYQHPHNDVFDALASGGLIGLGTLLLLYGVPFVIFWNARASVYDDVRAAGWMGLLTVTGFVVFGLTESMFVHSLVIGWYAIVNGALVASIATAPQQGKGIQARVSPLPW